MSVLVGGDAVERAEVLLKGTVRGDELDVASVLLHRALVALGQVVGARERGEACMKASAAWSVKENYTQALEETSAARIDSPHFFETIIFWRPGNLYWARRKASMTTALFESLQRMLMII